MPALPAPAPAIEHRRASGALVLVANPVPYLQELISSALAADGHRTVPVSPGGGLGAQVDVRQLGVDVAVIDAGFLLADPPDRLWVPPDAGLIVTGEGAHDVNLDGHPDACVLGGPLSLATLAESVARLTRHRDSTVAS